MKNRPTEKQQFGPAGAKLWRWLENQYDLAGVEPLAVELARLADRLGDLRAEIARDGVMIEGKKHPCVDLELKTSAAFARAWRLLGLSDDAERLGKGRPPGR